MIMVCSWIFKDNLESFLKILAWVAGYPFEDWDYDAVSAGIDGTNDEQDKWFNYEFKGAKRLIAFQVADDPGSSVLHFRITVPYDAVEMVKLAYFIGSGHELQRL